jgi:hypothetical protein
MTEPADESGTTAADAPDDEQAQSDHLADVEAGAGCTEIWEHLSERRAADED